MFIHRPAFSLIELTAVLAVVISTTAVLGPAMGRMRTQMRGASSVANVSAIGQASAMYAMDHEDRIFTFTWRAGVPYIDLSNGKMRVSSSDQEAASRQVQNILHRATGRLSGSRRILVPLSRLMHRRNSHLALADYMGTVGQSVWAHPDDYNQLIWQQFPLDFSIVPYGQGAPPPGYDSSSSWGSSSIRQLWAFASSYQVVPHAWLPDYAPTYGPTSSTPHLFTTVGGFPHLGDRMYNQVAFPSAKVHMFGEFDHDQTGNPYFAYDHAAPAKLMFDGSINTMPSGQAMSSVSPAQYSSGNKSIWSQHYLPIDMFPLPMGGLGDSTLLDMRYRWTLGGLQGVDYHQTLMPARGR